MDLSRFYPLSLLDQNFGLCISPQDLIFPSYNYRATNYYRPWKWYLQTPKKDFGSTIYNEKNKFKITLDVQHFEPSEINVKISDRDVIIEGKHEERQDSYGFISRQFKRRYLLPADCSADSVVSSLSSDGVLTVTADKTKELKTKEVIVPIKKCETCPNKDPLKTKSEKSGEKAAEDIKKADNNSCKKNMEIMLKEDHCCLLKPELLGAPSVAVTTQKTPENTNKDEFLKFSAETSGKTSSIEAKTEKLNVTHGPSTPKAEIGAASAAVKAEMCNIKSTLKESITVQESSTLSTSTSASIASNIKETSEKISEIVSDISAQLKEAAENI